MMNQSAVGNAIAIQQPDGWLLHGGDAWFYRGMAMDNAARRHNQQRLRELSCQRGGEITFFCSHDARELDALRVNVPLR
ncbi:hypothetical protein [Pantoea brenneri]|uniref:hypothetical protein n=1 Tax=Pantoea brenneri TaxID=472694 RepID=UPI000AAC7B01|nr:hypothetical protein [Pantoea brenneri]